MNRHAIAILLLVSILFDVSASTALSPRQRNIAAIASYTAVGNLDSLYIVLDHSLDSGMTVNEAREVLVHTYAYCGFPRSIQGLRTLVRVLGDRKERGIEDLRGREATPLDADRDRYQRGREILSDISGVPADAPKADYAILAPEIEVFLKEHLFSDLFERDVLGYDERELATVAVIASLGKGVEPMLASHSKLAIRQGITPEQIGEVVSMANSNRVNNHLIFAKGDEIKTETFEGKAWLSRLMSDAESFDVVVSDVVFDPSAHNDWHRHPGGQILIATSGKGYYQERGKEIRILMPGDVVAIRPGVEHWHGAATDSGFSHIAINTNVHLGPTEWLGKVKEDNNNNTTKQ